ncbi:hypothetical protein N9H39_06975 [Gammaproteobacteria bacterium]|nr:hypothetical protein [Gammaproteobacteria bacterium]
MYNDNYQSHSNRNHSILPDMNAFVPGLFVFERIADELMRVIGFMMEKVKRLPQRGSNDNTSQTVNNQVSSFLSAKEIRAMRRCC